MRYIPFVLLALVAGRAPAQSSLAVPQRESTPVITSAGEGERRVAPDMVTLFIAVETRSKSAVDAGARNAALMTAVMRALRGVGLEERELATSVYSLQPETWRNPNDTVYAATNGIRVETRKLNRLSRIVDTAMKAGANNIGSLQFGLSDNQGPEAEALGDAVRNARRRAEAMAAAAGGRLGALEELTSQPEMARPFMEGVAMARASAQGDVPTPISPREIIVTARVIARWRFVPR